uniref:NADH-ubiquinone oxidoreductase chain 6 n=1 Tax=Neophonus bruchi TaxID=1143075 RepID=A0A0S2M824_9COLE|nr:NADH deshydrogenase subunit 6 [Neophonus bruchi]
MMMLTMNLFLSITFIFLTHPMTMGLNLFIQTILISLMTGYLNKFMWFSYILFLIMIGGMLVLFMYMTSVASNELFKFSNLILLLFILMMTTTMMLMFLDNYFINILNLNTENLKFNLTLTKYLNYPFNIILVILILYLFLTLIATVKITKLNYGPLRQNF